MENKNHTLIVTALYREFETFNFYWNHYTPEEREIINEDFKKRLYELN